MPGGKWRHRHGSEKAHFFRDGSERSACSSCLRQLWPEPGIADKSPCQTCGLYGGRRRQSKKTIRRRAAAAYRKRKRLGSSLPKPQQRPPLPPPPKRADP